VANRKISQLTALTTPAAGDYLPIVDISEAADADKNKRITIEELLRGVPDGTAAAPSIAFESDPDSGLYSTGANGLALATGGTGRLFVNSSGVVSINTASTFNHSQLCVQGNLGLIPETKNVIGTSNVKLRSNLGTAASEDFLKHEITEFNNGANYGTALSFLTRTTTAATERLRITSTGQIQANSLGSAAAPVLSFNTDTNTGIYSPGADQVAIATGGTGRLFVDSSGRVGVGAFPASGTLLHISAAAPIIRISETDQAVDKKNWDIASFSGGLNFRALNDEGSAANRFLNAGRDATYGITAVIFCTGSDQERLRIDSSGRLLVGTSSARLGNVYASLQLEGQNSGTAKSSIIGRQSGLPQLFLGFHGGTANGQTTLVANGNSVGQVSFNGADGTDFRSAATITGYIDGTPGANDMPGRLVFATTADGASSPTERMRITSDAYVRLASGSGGIQFNGDTAAANALDDYEEGTFTLNAYDAITGGNVSATTATLSYTKIGRMVHVYGLGINNIDTTGMTAGNLLYLSLPFAAAAYFSGGEAHLTGSTLPNNGTTTGALVGPGAVSRFYLHSYNATGGVAGITVGDLTSGVSDVRYISITYQAL